MKVKEKNHSEFVNDVLNLNKRSQLKKPSRTEPTLQVSEFSLVKSVTGKEGGVRINDLTKVLKKRARHVEISKKVTSTGRKAKTLPKPLEKPRAERIRRTVAFENVKKQLNRWDAVVTSNRASDRLSFPLPDTKLETGKTFTGFRLKSDLQKELEELEPKVEVFNIEKESEFPLTMQEIMERRKDMAKMRAVQSYKEAKARRQSKIKSKKFHRVQRREKIKQQMKEFEQLQKTDPTEALKKLDEIERVRAEERASLRHRSTGKWAKSKQVQAKYDKESRQVLAQQLSLSRDLTQKLKSTGESESEEEAENNDSVSKSNENNPWMNPVQTSTEVAEFLSGYRKFWEDKNNESLKANQDNITNANSKINFKANMGDLQNNTDEEVESAKKMSTADAQVSVNESERESLQKNPKQTKQLNKPESIKEKIKEKGKSIQEVKRLNQLQSIEENTSFRNKVNQEAINNQRAGCKPESTKQQGNNAKVTPRVGTTNWEITVLTDEEDDIDNIFVNEGQKLQKTLKNKYKELKKDIVKQMNSKQFKEKPKKQKRQPHVSRIVDLSLSNAPKHPVIDEQLLENYGNGETANKDSLAILETILKDNTTEEEKSTTKTSTKNIDPNDIIKTKLVNLNTEIPDLLTFDDNEEDLDQRGTISEAFKDDDIVDEFKKDKKAEINGEKPQDINLTLPGWGSWGGIGIKPSKRKNKRFIIKFPKKFKRRDDNKGNLIINEKAKSAVKPHLVSEVPFPFKKVKDFEASIRAPIGNTFVPETAYRRMIRPAVKTKMGTIIEPMTDEILLRKKK